MKIKFSLPKLLIGYFCYLTLLISFDSGNSAIEGPIIVFLIIFIAYLLGSIPAAITGLIAGFSYQKTIPIIATIITSIAGGLSILLPILSLSSFKEFDSFDLFMLLFSFFFGLLSAFLTNIIVQLTIKNYAHINSYLVKKPIKSIFFLYLFLGPLVGLAIISIIGIFANFFSL